MIDLVSDDGRTHIRSSLMRESLQDRQVLARTDSPQELAILPDVVLVAIGGQSIFDRGRQALVPVAEQLAEAHREGHRMVVAVGGGTRVRHTVAIALDLGLPTGGIAQLVGAMEECNAVMLNALLARQGSIVMQREHFWELPLYLDAGMLPIVISIPPYHFWEPPPEGGPLPAHGSDFGVFAHAEVLGMRRIVFVKDVDGLYTHDPRQVPEAERIARTTLDAVRARLPETLPIDRQIFDTWPMARHVRRVQIVDGLQPETVLGAIRGEEVGTVIDKEAGGP